MSGSVDRRMGHSNNRLTNLAANLAAWECGAMRIEVQTPLFKGFELVGCEDSSCGH